MGNFQAHFHLRLSNMGFDLSVDGIVGTVLKNLLYSTCHLCDNRCKERQQL
jgi:hypothetical protein